MCDGGRRLVLFDIDGTLLTCRGRAGSALVRAMEEVYGARPSVDGYRYSGKTDPQIIHELMAGHGAAFEAVARDLPRVYARYLELLEEALSPAVVQVLPGVRAVLDALAARPEVELGLLTGNLAGGAAVKLRAAGLDGYFAFGAFGSDHADRNCLVPIARSRARAACGEEFPGRRTVVVGDAPADILCARAGEARSVAVASGWTPPAELAELEPDVLLVSLDLPDAAGSILGPA